MTRNMLTRFAGFLYLLVVPFGVFAILYVPSVTNVTGNPAATAENIQTHEMLYRLGMVSDLFAAFLMIAVVLALYRLLVPIHRDSARLMVALVLIPVPIVVLGQVAKAAPLILLSGAPYLDVFTLEQLQIFSYLALRLHGQASVLAFIFWGLWLWPLAYLVWKSGFLPRFLGVVLGFAGLGYVVDSFAILLGTNVGIGVYTGTGEIVFLLWLLIMGARDSEVVAP